MKQIMQHRTTFYVPKAIETNTGPKKNRKNFFVVISEPASSYYY